LGSSLFGFSFVVVERVAGSAEDFGLLFDIGFEAGDGGLGVDQLGTEFLERDFEVPIFFLVFVYRWSVSGGSNERKTDDGYRHRRGFRGR
jgi:hypothetical protein